MIFTRKEKKLYRNSLLPQRAIHLFGLALRVRGVALALKEHERRLCVLGVGQRALSPCTFEVAPRLSCVPAVSVGA
jgi:hypothetical protein